MKESSKGIFLLGMGLGAVGSCVLYKWYQGSSDDSSNVKSKEKVERSDLEQEYLRTKQDVIKMKQDIVVLQNALLKPQEAMIVVSASSREDSGPAVQSAKIVFNQFITEITVMQSKGGELTKEDMSQFVQKIVKGLDIFAKEFRQELREELRDQLVRTAKFDQEQKLAIFELLIGYILDTNLQQCHDFAHLRTLIDNSGPAEKERIYTSLRSQAMEAVENILTKATPLLENSMAGSLGIGDVMGESLIDHHNLPHSVGGLVHGDSPLQLGGAGNAQLDELA